LKSHIQRIKDEICVLKVCSRNVWRQDDCLQKLRIDLNIRNIERNLQTKGIITLKKIQMPKLLPEKIELTFEQLYFLCIINGRWLLLVS
jgi:hypothetical protein